MPDPLNAGGNEQEMPKGNKGYTQTSAKLKKSNTGYTKVSKPLKPIKPKGASVNDFDETVAVSNTPTAYTPYKMNGHELKGIKQRGVPFTGGVGSREDRTGVAGSLNPSPNNFIPPDMLSGLAGAGQAGGGFGGIMAKVKAAKSGFGGGGGNLEGRVAALEAGAGSGGDGAAAGAMNLQQGTITQKVQDKLGAPADQGLLGKMKAKKKGIFRGIFSDARLKEKIEKAGKSPSGIPIYMFNYIGENKRYEGAMAQDLISMGIDAVETHESGYYMVDYSKIDVDMKLIN